MKAEEIPQSVVDAGIDALEGRALTPADVMRNILVAALRQYKAEGRDGMVTVVARLEAERDAARHGYGKATNQRDADIKYGMVQGLSLAIAALSAAQEGEAT